MPGGRGQTRGFHCLPLLVQRRRPGLGRYRHQPAAAGVLAQEPAEPLGQVARRPLQQLQLDTARLETNQAHVRQQVGMQNGLPLLMQEIDNIFEAGKARLRSRESGLPVPRPGPGDAVRWPAPPPAIVAGADGRGGVEAGGRPGRAVGSAG